MNVYDQIDKIFSGESETIPQWAIEISNEIKELKELLKEQKSTYANNRYSKNKTSISDDFYNFIKQFRVSMKADKANNIYPTFKYFDKELGVDYLGLLYNKKDSKTLSKQEAFKVYRYAYQQTKKDDYSA